MALGHRVWIRGRGGPAWFTLISSLSKQHLTSLLWSPHLPYSPQTPSLSLNLSLSSSPSLSPLSDWNSHIHNSWSGEQKVPNKPVEPACQQSTIVCVCVCALIEQRAQWRRRWIFHVATGNVLMSLVVSVRLIQAQDLAGSEPCSESTVKPHGWFDCSHPHFSL